MYVDESGDIGVSEHSSKYFILSGLIVHENDWNECLHRLKNFRKSLKEKYGFSLRTEVHAAEFFSPKTDCYRTLYKSQRIGIFKDYIKEIPRIFSQAKLVNVCILKEMYCDSDIFNIAWNKLIQNFEFFLTEKSNEKGIIVSDDTDVRKLRTLQRNMRKYNLLPSCYDNLNSEFPIINVIEDVFMRSSDSSYFIQTIDVVAYSLYRKEYKKGALRKYGIDRQFDLLDKILLKIENTDDPLGIVRN